MTDYVIGIDIGATKSHLALFDTNGSLIDFGSWGPLNYECLPGLYAQFEDELKDFIAGIISKNKITMDNIAYSVIGAGGVDTKKQHENISIILKRLGFKSFTLVNDAFLGIPAGSRTGTGICAINGSGCTLAGINKKGETLQIGGIGDITADMGGGSCIGNHLVSAVYSELFRKGKPTLMTNLLFKNLGVTSKYDYIEKIHEKLIDGSFDIRKSNRMVFEAAKEKDSVAIGIIEDIAANYSSGISCMIEELGFPAGEELDLVLAGSVFVKEKDPLLINSLKRRVADFNPDHLIRYTLLDVPNVAGAVIWALRELGIKNTINEKIFEQLRRF
ncbi:MAG: hypothetical protein FWH35_08600 [Treponema sp.]|nr:hypothetical protein [Treponema sp.]